MDHAAHGAGGAEPHRRVLTAPLRVAVDLGARRLDRAGVARYAAALVTALADRDDVAPIAVGDGEYVEGGLRRKVTVLRQDLLWHPWLARRAARLAGAAVYHAPSPRAPLRRGRLPTVVSINDVNFVQRPETVSSWNGWWSRATLRRVVDAADRILCISQATADDVDHLLGPTGDRVRVVHLGVDARWFADRVAADRTGAPYVLCVATREPRKNLERAVEAMRRRRARGAPERLRVAGGSGWGHVVIDGAGVEALGRVPDDRLRALYAGAACLLMPSLHEGFGLPALEAMAAGCPVVASRRGALPEVCGDAAVLVDPLDPDDIARGVDEALARADELRDAGRARARRFTWAACAEGTLAVYRELA